MNEPQTKFEDNNFKIYSHIVYQSLCHPLQSIGGLTHSEEVKSTMKEHFITRYIDSSAHFVVFESSFLTNELKENQKKTTSFAYANRNIA